MSVKMPILTSVKCVICGSLDEAWWSEFGAEQPCLNCDAPAVFLSKN